ncbi:MAG: diacylglycerol kinase family protein [Clostridia bacterium]|nr:diacylglycerol kinase family protein [Clostridia bacterium]
MKKYILYNPLAGNGSGRLQAKQLAERFGGDNLVLCDVREIENYGDFFAQLDQALDVIVCGGDGTLNRFVNDIRGLKIENPLYYFACGSGNDFLRDVEHDNGLVSLAPYLENLPTVSVQGKEYAFLNGVGYGIDGYCCEVGDKLRMQKPGEAINYTSIAIKGLLFHYKPVDATVIVDGKEYRFKKVWLAPTMNGRYYGGGMLPAPDQRRQDAKLSLMLFHGSGKLKTLLIFPSIFKGEHVKKVKNVTVLSGNEITVRYDEPRALQIDGETIVNVSEYTARK